MAAQLKNLFDVSVVRSIAADLRSAHPSFDERGFLSASTKGLGSLELTARGWHLAEAMNAFLPTPFARAANVLVASLGTEHAGTEAFGFTPFRYMPHVFFVQKYGLDDFEASMRAQYELTKRFTAESSIRAFLVAHPAATLERLHLWARDPNPHVRRLVSEGTRPRLPWAPRLRAFQADPGPVLELLELLKDDPERYVQRSVANNLNDIGKDHPDLAAAVCERWTKDAPAGRRWIVQHALRHLIKRGHRGALETLGVGARPKIAIDRVRVAPKRVDLGGEVRFSFRIASTAPKPQDLMIDYAVHYVKANGAPRPKVFKLKRVTLPAGDEVQLSGKISLVDLTTRRHHPGKHGVDVVVNGVTHPLAAFDVRG